MNVDFKTFRDNKSKIIISYWTMNKDDSFVSCDLSNTKLNKLDDHNLIEDYGCTFLIQGKCLLSTADSDEILETNAGEVGNRRRKGAIVVKALEDNTQWCYCLHFNSLFTTNITEGLQEDLVNPKLLTGESIKISAGEILEFVDNDKDVWIADPICTEDPELNAISYKPTDKEEFSNLVTGKLLKILKGKTYFIKSNIDTYIPKVFLDTLH